MIRKIVLLLIVLVLSSCKERDESKNNEKIGSSTQKSDVENKVDWKTKIIDFQPTEIDLSRNQFLHDESLVNFLTDERIPKEDREYVVNVILLKQYLYHLQRANQGYNLLTMGSNQNVKSIINYYLKVNEISTNQEFINSAVAYNMLEDKYSTDYTINQLKKSIEAELR